MAVPCTIWGLAEVVPGFPDFVGPKRRDAPAYPALGLTPYRCGLRWPPGRGDEGKVSSPAHPSRFGHFAPALGTDWNYRNHLGSGTAHPAEGSTAEQALPLTDLLASFENILAVSRKFRKDCQRRLLAISKEAIRRNSCPHDVSHLSFCRPAGGGAVGRGRRHGTWAIPGEGVTGSHGWPLLAETRRAEPCVEPSAPPIFAFRPSI